MAGRTLSLLAWRAMPAAQQKALMAEHSRRWIANAMRTDSIDHAECTAAVKELYAAAGLEEPRVVIVPSPRILAFAAGFACAFWHLHDHASSDADAPTVAAASAAAAAMSSDAVRAAIYTATRAAFSAATRDAAQAARRRTLSDPVILASYGDFDPVVHARTDPAIDEATDGATLLATAKARPEARYATAIRETAFWTAYEATGEIRLSIRYMTDGAVREAAADPEALFAEIAAALLGPRHASFGLKCAKVWRRCYQAGNLASDAECSRTAERDILGLGLQPGAVSDAWERCARAGGFRFVHARFCMVSDFPEELRVDAHNRLHCTDGPALRWRDGWEFYRLHGLRVPREVVMEPHMMTAPRIDGEKNVEVRRVMIEQFGAERYMRESGAVLLHQDHRGKLWRKDRAGDTPHVMVEVRNSTPESDGSVKNYWLRVPPECRTASEAVAWTFGLSAKGYSPKVET
jgi:hypothetical protein